MLLESLVMTNLPDKALIAGHGVNATAIISQGKSWTGCVAVYKCVTCLRSVNLNDFFLMYST